MSVDIKLPEGAPEEVVTQALVRQVDLSAFGAKGVLALITLDNSLVIIAPILLAHSHYFH